jgi:signal transduction histidine kinase
MNIITINNLGAIKEILVPMFNLSRSAVIIDDADSKILMANKAFCMALDESLNPEDLLSESIEDLSERYKHFYPDKKAFFDRVDEIKKNKKLVSNEILEFNNNRVYSRDYVPISINNNISAHYWQYNDITDAVNAQKQLEDTLLLKSKYDKLNKNMMSIASHELRTPLTSIKSTVDLLLSGIEHYSKEAILDKLNRVKRATYNMNKLIDDIMALGVLENYDLKNGELVDSNAKDFENMIRELAESCLPERNIVFEYEGVNSGLVCRIYKNLFLVAIKNLLINAHLYSEPNKSIFIKFILEPKTLTINVRDEGVGIPSNDLHRVFELFERGSNVQNVSGTGLGLAITKRVIDIIGGEIQINSEVGTGTIVSIILEAH